MTLIYVLIFILGLVIGSFLNCLIWRLYKDETVMGRSYCPHYKKTIHWYHNIPLLSFFLLKRRCFFCKKKISWQYPLVEFITGLLFVLVFYFNSGIDFSFLKFFYDLVFISLLIIIFVFDFRWYLVSINVVIFGCIFFFILNVLLGYSIQSMLLNVLLGVGFFALQYYLTILIIKKKGLGEGDIWLGAFFGLAFPIFSQFVGFLFLTYLIGGLVAIILMIFGFKKMYSRIPLGIFLSLAAVIMLFWGNSLVNWYFNLII